MKNPVAKLRSYLEPAQAVLVGVGLLGGLCITTVLVIRGLQTEPVPVFVIVGLVMGASLTCTGLFGGLLLGRRSAHGALAHCSEMTVQRGTPSESSRH